MRWNRRTVQSIADLRVAALDGTLEAPFRKLYPAFRQADEPAFIAAHA